MEPIETLSLIRKFVFSLSPSWNTGIGKKLELLSCRMEEAKWLSISMQNQRYIQTQLRRYICTNLNSSYTRNRQNSKHKHFRLSDTATNSALIQVLKKTFPDVEFRELRRKYYSETQGASALNRICTRQSLESVCLDSSLYLGIANHFKSFVIFLSTCIGIGFNPGTIKMKWIKIQILFFWMLK